jgi:hypothetical protein
MREPAMFGEGQRPGSTEDCGFTRHHLHAFIEVELDPIRCNLLREHLGSCTDCRELAEDLKLERLWVVESMVDSPALSLEFLPRVMQQARTEARRAAWAARRRAWLPWLGVAALLVGAALVASRFDGGRAPAPEPLAVAGSSGGPRRVHTGSPGVERAVPAVPVVAPVVLASSPPAAVRRDPEERRPLPEQHPAPGRSRGGVPSFGQVVSFASSLAPLDRRAPVPAEDDPCKPDLNSDGRTDWCDVAYSLQVLVRGAPPEALHGEEPTTEATDCDDHCFRA